MEDGSETLSAIPSTRRPQPRPGSQGVSTAALLQDSSGNALTNTTAHVAQRDIHIHNYNYSDQPRDAQSQQYRRIVSERLQRRLDGFFSAPSTLARSPVCQPTPHDPASVSLSVSNVMEQCIHKVSEKASTPTIPQALRENGAIATTRPSIRGVVGGPDDFEIALLEDLDLGGRHRPRAWYRSTGPTNDLTLDDIYIQKLYPSGHGYPCPNPSPQGPPIQIGDIGEFTSSGFTVLANLANCQLPSLQDHLQTLRLSDVWHNPSYFCEGQSITGGVSVHQITYAPGTELPETIKYRCENDQGAILVVGSSAELHKLAHPQPLRRWLGEHAMELLEFVDNGRTEPLCLVTGRVTSSSWATATYSDLGTSPDLTLGRFHHSSRPYQWTQPGNTRHWAQSSNTINSAGERVKDQCLFLLGFLITPSCKQNNSRNRSALKIAEENSHSNHFSPGHGTAGSSSSADSNRFPVLGEGEASYQPMQGEGDTNNSKNATVDIMPSQSSLDFYPPFSINRTLLEQTGADAAIVHDDDWIQWLGLEDQNSNSKPLEDQSAAGNWLLQEPTFLSLKESKDFELPVHPTVEIDSTCSVSQSSITSYSTAPLRRDRELIGLENVSLHPTLASLPLELPIGQAKPALLGAVEDPIPDKAREAREPTSVQAWASSIHNNGQNPVGTPQILPKTGPPKRGGSARGGRGKRRGTRGRRTPTVHDSPSRYFEPPVARTGKEEDVVPNPGGESLSLDVLDNSHDALNPPPLQYIPTPLGPGLPEPIVVDAQCRTLPSPIIWQDLLRALKEDGGRSPYEIVDHPSIPLGAAAMARRISASPLIRQGIERAIENRHREHPKFSIDIRLLENPSDRTTLVVTQAHSLLELYVLVFFVKNLHPEEGCLYWQGKALDLSRDSARRLQGFGIEDDSTLVASRPPPRGFAVIIPRPHHLFNSSRTTEGTMPIGSKVIIHKLLSPLSARCSGTRGPTVTIPMDSLSIKKVFDPSFAEELAGVTGKSPHPVEEAPFRQEELTLEGKRPRVFFAALMGRKSIKVRAPLYLPPWSLESIATATSAPPPSKVDDPHFLLRETFGPSMVIFEVRSPRLMSADDPPCISIEVKCASHGEERISFITLEVTLPEQDNVVRISPERLLGPADEVTISGTQTASTSAGASLELGVEYGKLSANHTRKVQEEVNKTFTGRSRCRIAGIKVGHSQVVWTLKENQNQLDGLPEITNLVMHFDHKPRTVFMFYHIDVAKDRNLETRKSAACFLFP